MRRLPAGRLALTLGACVLLALVGGTPALAAQTPAPWWWTGTEATPSNLPPEHGGRAGEGTIVAVVGDLGDGPASGAGGEPISISDTLPAGVLAAGVSSPTVHGTQMKCQIEAEAHRVGCSFAGTWYPYERVDIPIGVKVEEPEGTVTTLPNHVSVQGGGASHDSSSSEQLTISGEATPFGVQEQGYQLVPYNEEGSPETQAGAHPFQLTSTLVLNQTGTAGTRQPVALPRNLGFPLPLGLIGDPAATEQCPTSEFFAHAPVSEVDECPPGSVVGVASVTVDEPEVSKVVTLTDPLFNLAPSEGEPARFGFEALGLVPVIIDTSLDPSDGYAVVASVQNATAIAGLLSSQVTIWGVPGDPRHDPSRGWECINGGVHHEKGEVSTPCPASSSLPQTPLLTLPTSCPSNPAVEPLKISMQAESWPAYAPVAESGQIAEGDYTWLGALGEPLGFTGCEELPFEPSVRAAAGEAHSGVVHAGGAPTGLSAIVKLPQGPTVEANPQGRAEADVRDTAVTLPAGMTLNPSAANGLEACPETQRKGALYEGVGFERFQKLLGPEREPEGEVGVFTPTFRFVEEEVEGRRLPPSCPPGSKVGVVRIKTPLLPRELEGAVYMAEPAPYGEEHKNPFDSLIALYIVAEDKEAGVLVKLAGKGELNQETGQLSTSFRDTPQLPFEELKLELFGGQRASLSTPAVCGTYSTLAEFTPWSLPFTAPAVDRSSAGEEFDITENCSAGTPLGFSPAFDAQSTSTQAGAFTGFSLQLERPDGDQALSGLSVHLPAGIAALLSSVTPCPIAVADAGQCSQASLIGESNVSSGVGSEPFTLPGSVYLTSGFDGAPFGVSVLTSAEHVGPFDIGTIVSNSTVEVNENTAAVTIGASEARLLEPDGHTTIFASALPTIVKGIPVQLKRLSVDVNRSGFELNPTSCEPASIDGSLSGSEGASASVSSRFQVGGCSSLPFSPELVASAAGHGSKAEGTTLKVTVRSGGVDSTGVAQAGIAKVDLQLPKQLSSRLPTLQKACVDSVFEANPAGCDPESVIGYATIHTPVLTNPLTGPAYLVSHGGAAFPDVEFVLQGEGIKLILDGKTDIKGELTYSRFESAPDAPFTVFETVLPAGPHGVLTPNVAESKHFDLCGETLAMPTTIVAHNGATIEQDTKIALEGCGAVEGAKVKRLTRAQQLANALKACQKKYKRSKTRRVACERQARKRYAVKKASPKNKAHKTSIAPHHHD